MKTWKAYKKVQKDNTRRYKNLTKDRQKHLREKGYIYYIAVTNESTNEVQYVDLDWYTWPILWPKTKVDPLESYESAAKIVEVVSEFARPLNLPWKIEIQWEPK